MAGDDAYPGGDTLDPWVGQAPLHPPERSVPITRAPGPPTAYRSSPRPERPPIYDPAHYGYGPWRQTSDDPPLVLPPLDETPTRWQRWRGPVLGGLVGAGLVAMAVLATLALVDDGSRTVETVFEFPTGGPSSVLQGDELDIQAVLAKVQPSVVSIDTGASSARGVFEGAGSGVVIGEGGLVLTNAHVIEGADVIEVSFFDGTVKEADLVGSFPDDDIAIIRARDVRGLIPADLGTVENLRVGDEVVAIGNALSLGESPSVTKGIVSAKGRDISDGVLELTNLIQTDAAINPGNSGGALINAVGEVVGINTAIFSESGGSHGIGFAIPIQLAKEVMRQLIEHGHVIRGWLGITGQD
ncbi:MAG: S1C family serine protease, partial [Acidimicrobiales bacterium]